MKQTIAFTEHSTKAVQTDERFEHVMALMLNPQSNYKEGIIRCITSREGSEAIKGFTDRSVLHIIKANSPEHFVIGDRLLIKDESEIIKQLTEEDGDFLGLEDPDIFIDKITNLTHVYFTIPFKSMLRKRTLIYLGHAVGEDLNSLAMTIPVLQPTAQTDFSGAKEVSVAPINKQGFRYNLVESGQKEEDFTYSVVKTAIAEDMGKSWQFGEIVFHPKEHTIPWISGHASPGPLFPKTFIDFGENKLIGIMNGREASQKVDGKTHYGIFSIGLFIYDYEDGKIDWVSPEPLIRDSEAKTITFASQFVETTLGEGILYAHVDDSFIRAYTLYADGVRELLP